MEKRVQKKEDGRYIIFYTFLKAKKRTQTRKRRFHVRITLEPTAQAVVIVASHAKIEPISHLRNFALCPTLPEHFPRKYRLRTMK